MTSNPEHIPHSIRRAGSRVQTWFPEQGWGAAIPAAGSYRTEHGGCKGQVSHQQEGWSRPPAVCPHPCAADAKVMESIDMQGSTSSHAPPVNFMGRL